MEQEHGASKDASDVASNEAKASNELTSQVAKILTDKASLDYETENRLLRRKIATLQHNKDEMFGIKVACTTRDGNTRQYCFGCNYRQIGILNDRLPFTYSWQVTLDQSESIPLEELKEITVTTFDGVVTYSTENGYSPVYSREPNGLRFEFQWIGHMAPNLALQCYVPNWILAENEQAIGEFEYLTNILPQRVPNAKLEFRAVSLRSRAVDQIMERIIGPSVWQWGQEQKEEEENNDQ